MGYETKCRVRVDDRSGTVREADLATVLLETDELVVRGDARVRVPRTAIERVTTRGGVVTVTAPNAIVSLTLGDVAAAKWKMKLEEPPKRLIDKLDVKPDARVWTLGINDDTLMRQLGERTANVTNGRSATSCDVVFVQVDRETQLARVDKGAEAIADHGAIWVIHPKGANGIADTTIFGRASALGLVYTKVARISETLTAEKLVKPLAARAAATTTARTSGKASPGHAREKP
jgi:hypothetical protein